MEISTIDYGICEIENCNKGATVLLELGYDKNGDDLGAPIIMYLCDECLQELNRKIVQYLAEKNI